LILLQALTAEKNVESMSQAGEPTGHFIHAHCQARLAQVRPLLSGQPFSLWRYG
jgi:hypothetical protein